MKNKRYQLKLMLLAVGISGMFLSCSQEDELPTPVEVAYVSIYHGSPDTEGIDIKVSTGQVNDSPFMFKDYSSYLNFYTGDRNMKFIDATTGVLTLVDTTFTFTEDKSYSIFVANTASNLEAVLLEDSFPNEITGKAMVRFVQLSPDVDQIDVVADEEDLFSLTDFKNGTEFKPVDAGRITFEFKETAGENVVLTASNVELLSRNYYTIVLNGFNNPPSGNTHDLSADFIRL